VSNPFSIGYHAYLDGVKDTVGFEVRELGNSTAVSIGEQIGADYVSSHDTWYLTEEQAKKLHWELSCYLDNKAHEEQELFEYLQDKLEDAEIDENRMGSSW